jgi:hypothetical protein
MENSSDSVLPSWSFSMVSFKKVKLKVTLRLAVYRQSVRLDVKPLETHDQTFFQLNSCGNSPYVTSSLTRRWVCLLWISLAFRQVYISHIQHVIENVFFLHYTQILCQYRLCRADHAYLTYRMLIHLHGEMFNPRDIFTLNVCSLMLLATFPSVLCVSV